MISPFFMLSFKYNFFFFSVLILFFSNISATSSQEIDVDSLLDRLKRIEKNLSDIQKGRLGDLDKSLSSGYISRNESRLDEIETNSRKNYGVLEEIQNKIKNLDDKLDLINSDFQSRLVEIEKKLKKFSEIQKNQSNNLSATQTQNTLKKPLSEEQRDFTTVVVPPKSDNKNSGNILTEEQIREKYENAIKLLWANKYEEAKDELKSLKTMGPPDLMPNIQYWLGEVFYAQKNFERAVIEFGDGLQKYPDSIKGPDNMLKLGLSFSNLNRKDDACNVLYELEVKYKSSSKNVLERAGLERKKLNCPKE